MTYTNAFLACCAAFFLFTAGFSGLAPARFAEQLGLAVANPGGLTEVRAQYAGFFAAAAIVSLAAIAGRVTASAALLAIAMIFGGLIAGRLIGVVLNGGVKGFPPTVVGLIAVDALGFAGAAALIWRSRPAG